MEIPLVFWHSGISKSWRGEGVGWLVVLHISFVSIWRFSSNISDVIKGLQKSFPTFYYLKNYPLYESYIIVNKKNEQFDLCRSIKSLLKCNETGYLICRNHASHSIVTTFCFTSGKVSAFHLGVS